MKMEICSLASSSAGNSFLIRTAETNLLLDVGITMKRMDEALAESRITYQELDGVFITHEHIDHVKGLRTLVRRRPFEGRVYASGGTCRGILEKEKELPQETFTVISAGEIVEVGDITVRAFNLSHDSREPLGFTFSCEGRKAAVITDTGCITEEVFQSMRDADVLFIESNHERNVLLYGPYPYPLKTRILSDLGHLSNEAAADCLVRFLKERSVERKAPPKVVLSHLSDKNNTPKQAYITVMNLVEEAGFVVGKDLSLEVAPRSETGTVLVV